MKTVACPSATSVALCICAALVSSARPLNARQQGEDGEHIVITGVGDVFISDEGVISRVDDSTERAELVLYVGNRSQAFQLTDIAVTLDSSLLLNRNFESVPHHDSYRKYVVLLPNGRHMLQVSSSRGERVIRKRFRIKREGWAIIDFDDQEDESSAVTRPRLVFKYSKEKILFQ